MHTILQILTPTIVATGVVSVALALVLYLARPCSEDEFYARCFKIVGRIKRFRCNPLSEALDEYSVANDQEFFDSIHGLAGLMESLEQLRHHFALTQLHFFARRISLTDAAYIWRCTLLQLWFTLRAIPEVLVCRVVPGYPHACAFMAANFHRAEMLRMVTACVTDCAPMFMRELRENL